MHGVRASHHPMLATGTDGRRQGHCTADNICDELWEKLGDKPQQAQCS